MVVYPLIEPTSTGVMLISCHTIGQCCHTSGCFQDQGQFIAYLYERQSSILTNSVKVYTIFKVNHNTLIKNFRSILKVRHTKGRQNGYHFQQCTEIAIL